MSNNDAHVGKTIARVLRARARALRQLGYDAEAALFKAVGWVERDRLAIREAAEGMAAARLTKARLREEADGEAAYRNRHEGREGEAA